MLLNIKDVIFILVTIIVFNAHHAQALIPMECGLNITRRTNVCCPKNPRNNEVCGGQSKGYCRKIITAKDFIPHIFKIDDRIHFPLRYFQFACQCKGNYFGISCEKCWFGWKGKNCNEREMKIRRDIRTYSSKELEIFKDVIVRSQTWPSGYYILDESTNWRSDPLKYPKLIPASIQYYATFLHGYTSRSTLFKDLQDCKEYGILDFSHDGPVFPVWHRYFMFIWERMLANIAYKVHRVKSFTIPYWDWIGMEHCDVCTNKYIGATGIRDYDGLHISKYSPFENLTEFCTEPDEPGPCYGCQSAGRTVTITREFTSTDFGNHKDIKYLMGLKDYWIAGERTEQECKSFHMGVEGYCGRTGSDPSYRWFHNKMHVMIDGSMCCANTATNDPLFMLHHTFLDKIFTAWMRKHKPTLDDYPDKNVRPGHGRDDFLTGLIPLCRTSYMFDSTEELGYMYDNMLFGKYGTNENPIYIG